MTRLFDIVFSFIAMVVLLPFMLPAVPKELEQYMR